MDVSIKQQDFLNLLESSLGVVSVALDKTNTTKEEYDEWMDNVTFSRKVDEIKDKSLDYVENQLMREINKGNLQAITYYLKTKGKHRGYF